METTSSRERGVSFIEVLIALLILSVGIVGGSQLLMDAKAIQQAAIRQQKVTFTKTVPSMQNLPWNLDR